MRKISELVTCHNPDGRDFFPILDVNGGTDGKPKTKKVSLAKLVSLSSNSGIIKDTFQYIGEDFLLNSQSNDGLISLSKSFALISISANMPGKLRIYKSIEQRELDRNRGDIDPIGNHGVILEIIFPLSLLEIDLLPIVFGSSTQQEFPIIFTSLSEASLKPILSIVYLPIEI